MVDNLYSFPLLDITNDDSDAAKLHKTCIALRQLYNTRDHSDSAEPDSSLGGSLFGVGELRELLQPRSSQRLFDYTPAFVESSFGAANSSGNRARDMANFVHWATDIAVQTLYKDPARVAKRGARGAAIMRPVQELLQQHTQKVSAILADEISNDREDQDHRLLLQLLGDLFNAIKQHHVRVSDSDAGLQEILALGKETTFVHLGSNSPVNVRELYETMVVKSRLPMHQFLESAEVVIERQLMEQKHCMPLEYGIATLAPAISTLEPHLLQRLHVEQWAEWTERLGLGHIGELIVSRAKARLESLDLKLYAPISATPRGVYKGSPRRPSNTSEAPTCQLAEASRQDAEGKILEPITMFGEGWGFMSTMQNRRLSLSDTSSRTMRPGPGKATSISHSQRQARGSRSETSNIRGKAISCPVLQGPNA